MDEQPKLLIPVGPDFCKATGVSRATGFAWVHEEGFPVIRQGKRLLIPVKQLETYLEERAKMGANA